MFKRLTNTVLFSLPFAAATALAHPGDHEHLSPTHQASHFMSDPWHVGLALAVAVIAIALERRWLFGDSR